MSGFDQNVSLIRGRRKLTRQVVACMALQAVALASAACGLLLPASTARVFIAFSVCASAGGFATFLIIGRLARRLTREQGEWIGSATEASRQMEELFAMTDMLQAADDYDDAATVLEASTTRLLPEYGASLYIFNNSRDRLDLTRSWNLSDDFNPPETLHPNHCWALKRGKPHINDPQSSTLCCVHHSSNTATVEIPMMARGTVHGLLVIESAEERAFKRLLGIRRLGRALADSMSLALSNITLREKLRTQSLRDPLTGLYNRRYMEDALERFMSLATRTGGSTAVIMLDLDNFKTINDEHGHAKGDAILRDVAAQLVGGLRPTDVVCRYGGEELIALLPDCSLENAEEKAEHLRARVAALSDAHQCRISASFGVASVPETSISASDVLPMADSALYEAKQAGKNCVKVAARRADRKLTKPRLAKTA